MTDNAVGGVLVFFEEFLGARESNLVDVFLDVVGCHADAVVADGKGAFFLVDCNGYLEVTKFALELAERGECAEFLGGVDCVRHQLAQEYFVV